MIPDQYLSHNFRLWRTSQQPTASAWRLLTSMLLLWILSSSLVVTAAPLATDVEGAEQPSNLDYLEERWLADGTFYDVDQPYKEDELCPRVPKELPVGSCDVTQCSSDDECSERQLKCCYNGCVYTCLAEVNRPIYIDWIQAPRRRSQYVELCTTTSLEDDDDDDADPLICPHGYECSIDDPGEPEVGIPNRGHCVKVIDREITETLDSKPSLSMDQTLQADAPYSDYTPPKNCPLGQGGLVLLSGHSIVIQNGRECLCEEAELKCDIKAKPAS